MKSKFLTVLLLTVAVLVAALLLVGCSDQEQCIVVNSIEDLQKARIGVETGTVFDEKAKSLLPDFDIKYYNSNFDLTAASQNRTAVRAMRSLPPGHSPFGLITLLCAQNTYLAQNAKTAPVWVLFCILA